MKPLSELIDPAIWVCAGVATLGLLAGAGGKQPLLRTLGRVCLLLASLALLAGLAHPLLLPVRSASVHPDGTTDDPRVLSALLVGLAALVSLLPAWLATRVSPVRALGLALPGVLLAALLGAVATFEGLRQPIGMVGLVLGGFGVGTALTLAIRTSRQPGVPAGVFQGFGASLLVIAAMLSLHGARATGLKLVEGSAADTLGQHLALTHVRAPSSDLHVLDVALGGGRDSVTLHPELRGGRGTEVRSVAGARLFSGPLVVPIALDERRGHAHDLSWLAKQEVLKAGEASIRFTGFRIEHTDSIRMFADLEVTTAGGVEKVSPGVVATSHGERPFAAVARGFGPVAIAAIDADHGRVGLMLPQLSNAGVTRVAVLDLRLRPALPVAWLGAGFSLLGFLLALLTPGRRKATA